MAHSTITLKVSTGVRDALILAAKVKDQTMHQFALSCILTEAVQVMCEEERKLLDKKE